ncbi:alpha/beta fold hydrolase [Stieleria sp.]|uniref:alpha/beta fold hydrolase n=1 Tax=Stieleria sp. TaxID=2795976 RepID=UPI0035664C9A
MDVRRSETLSKISLRVVHGFAVASFFFRPLISRLSSDSSHATLFRYPSVGLSLEDIVAKLSLNLREQPPDAIVAHSLGCVATWLAVHEAKWNGPIVMLAPPFSTIPSTRLLPRFLRWPFAPLLDHRALTAASGFQLPKLTACPMMTVAGRFDFSVPLSCTRHGNLEESLVTFDTHNSMLFSSSVATACLDWVVRNHTASDLRMDNESMGRG